PHRMMACGANGRQRRLGYLATTRLQNAGEHSNISNQEVAYMAVLTTDRIEKKILLRAPHARIWRALTDADEFGTWFGMKFDGRFAPGAQVKGVISPTTVDAEV